MSFSVQRHKLQWSGKQVEYIRSPYTGGAFANVPNILVMHFTYGNTGRSSADWFRDPKNPGSSAHLVIDRNGSVIQCVDFNVVAWHAGKSRLRKLSGLNQYALGIELANWGYLEAASTGWTSHTGVAIPNPMLAAHPNGNPPGYPPGPIGWEPYPTVQIDAAVAVAKALVSAYGIDEIVGHDFISPKRKWDPGPAFDMLRFRNQVFGDRSDDGDVRLRVAVASGLNLRKGPGTQFDSVQLLPLNTLVEPIREEGRWLEVSVIDAQGEPIATGWVHGAYLAE